MTSALQYGGLKRKIAPEFFTKLPDASTNKENESLNLLARYMKMSDQKATYEKSTKNLQLRQYIDDILVINSLKEQGIQYYRTEVKTFCQTRCSIQGKKKIVILDDIDNINEQSQQVFRNCIDKYSNNVHFISSCSNIQKVIDSLQSRKIIIKLN